MSYRMLYTTLRMGNPKAHGVVEAPEHGEFVCATREGCIDLFAAHLRKNKDIDFASFVLDDTDRLQGVS